MDLFSSVVVMATSLVGSVVMTVCGFGFGGVVMAVWPYIMPYSQSVAVAALCGFTTAFIVVVTNFRYINYKILVPCMITGLIAAAAAVAVSVGAAEKVMMRSLGVALMALSFYSIFLGGKIRIKATPLNGMIAGTLAGTLSGLFAVGGPPAAIYLLSSAENNDEYRATLNAHFCGTTVFATIMRIKNGIITGATLHAWLIAAVAIVLGIFLGNKIFHRLNGDKLRKIVYAYLAVSGFAMLLK